MRRLSWMLAVVVVFAAVSSGSAVTAAVPSGPPQAFSMLGMANVGGEAVIVDVVVAVRPGQNPADVARAALRQQGARPLDSAEFSTTGLVWDQFSDADSGNDFVTQYYNQANEPVAGGPALVSSQGTWTGVSTAAFVLQNGGTTNRCPSLVRECQGPQFFDGNNDVAWLELSGCCTLGVTWYGTSTDEADMALNLDFDWATDGEDFDVETVFLHENGHVVGLGHSNVAGAVMEATYAGVRRVLHQDDIDGITFLYSAASDITAPSFSSGSVAADGTTVTVTFDEALAASAPPGSAFAVTTVSGTVFGTAAPVSISGTDVTFTLASALVAGETATLAYTQPGSDPRIQDAAGNPTASFSGVAITNNTVAPDITAPSFSSGSVAADGTTVTVTFDEALAASAPPGSAFAVTTVSGTVFGTAAPVSISGTDVTFTLASALVAGETATLAYTQPGSDPRIQDAAGNPTASFSGVAITNNTVAPATGTLHVGDLDGQGVKLKKGNWKALVTVTVHDANHQAVPDATVTGTFTQNGSSVGPLECLTDGSGTCTIPSGQFPNKGGNATFTVVTVTHADLAYQAADNHVTSIALSK